MLDQQKNAETGEKSALKSEDERRWLWESQ